MSSKEKESSIRKKRGVIRASTTRLANRLSAIESKSPEPATKVAAQQALQKLKTHDAEFKVYHLELVDVIKGDEALEAEQEVLDVHDDNVAEITIRIERVIANCAALVDSSEDTVFFATRKLSALNSNLSSMRAGIHRLSGSKDETPLLHQYEEEIAEEKRGLSSLYDQLIQSKLDDSHKLFTLHASLKGELFELLLDLKKLTHAEEGASVKSESGVKLPKLDIPTFDGNLLHWKTFWEQFKVSVHDRTSISDSEKLVYLRNAVKDGKAKGVIEGLSRSGDFYAEAVESLCARYDRPRLIHQSHVRMIMETPALKDGNGGELRRLHDTVQQHLRALKALGYEPSGPFITAILELKLDVDTAFEWQKHSQDATAVPPYTKLLEFLNLRAQASETSIVESKRPQRTEPPSSRKSNKHIVSFTGDIADSSCVVCKAEKHPLYVCGQFKSLTHDRRLSIVRSNNCCLNCLKPGHHSKDCKSTHRCQRCQKPHHTLLHLERREGRNVGQVPNAPITQANVSMAEPVSEVAHLATGIPSNALLMTCQIVVIAPDGSSANARALLDSGSSVSFVSERITQALCLPRSRKKARITGVAGLTHNDVNQSIANFDISSTYSQCKKIPITAVVVPRVTCNLPLQSVRYDKNWKHLSDLQFADPDFGSPRRIDVLLGVDVFISALLLGRRSSPPGSPTAFETEFGWVLAGGASTLSQVPDHISALHVSLLSGDDILRKFWEMEEGPRQMTGELNPEETSVVRHFQVNHSRTSDGRFVVPLPKKSQTKPLGESRSQAVRRFLSLERSLQAKNQFKELDNVIQEYFEMNHAELVPVADLCKPSQQVFYLPIHAVRKESSSTTKVRAVFDASAKSASGISLNDILLVGPTVHSSLIDVLLRFRMYRIALTTDVSKMYRAIQLEEFDKDLHRFVWRRSPAEPIRDYRMTRVTFGVSASSFAANMSIKQNALDNSLEYPLACQAVQCSFYVDDGLTGADTTDKAIELQRQLQTLFSKGGFQLHKWNSSDPAVMKHLPDDIKDPHSLQVLPGPNGYTKTLGIEWNSILDHFRLSVADLPPLREVTKRFLVSDISKVYDVLGWFSPSTIKVKVLLQQVWERNIAWDDRIPSELHDIWMQWRSELRLLSSKFISRCYYPTDSHVTSSELHGFCDASEVAYAAVVYLRFTDSENRVHVTLVTSKTKVAPLKRLTIPRLELCGAHLLSQLLHHVRQVFEIPLSHVYAWCDSTIVLNWLDGNPRRFKTYVGNRISNIMDLIPPAKWHHVNGLSNPADCASRGLFPSELLKHALWWNGPGWLSLPPNSWPQLKVLPPNESKEEVREIALHTISEFYPPLFPVDRFSNFTRLKRVTSWIFRFVQNCRITSQGRIISSLSADELKKAELYWVGVIQKTYFRKEIQTLKGERPIHRSSPLLSLHPLVDSAGILRVGGRQQLQHFKGQNPMILHGKHSLTRVIVRTEHLRLLHAGPMLLTASLACRYHIVGGCKIIRSTTRGCVTCRRNSAQPRPQMMGQLPIERVTPGTVFETVGIDYAGPILSKLGHTRKPTIVKSYVCIFVSLTVKAVHLELVSDLTAEAFIACLRRFIARRGKPSLIWSDNGTNFVGAAREIRELLQFLNKQQTQGAITDFLSTQMITWKFIPQRAPHFGGLWEAAVKSMKMHLRKVMGEVKLSFEELTTVLTQIEACLNSRPLTPFPNDDDGIEALTPGHFLIGRSLESLPDSSYTNTSRDIHLLRRWELCQTLVRHFWKRWSTEYITNLNRFKKWHYPSRNMQVGDLVILREDSAIPTKWPLARIVDVHPGKDGLVRVATIKTKTGTYVRPVVKLALVLPTEAKN